MPGLAIRVIQLGSLHPSIFEKSFNCIHSFWELSFRYKYRPWYGSRTFAAIDLNLLWSPWMLLPLLSVAFSFILHFPSHFYFIDAELHLQQAGNDKTCPTHVENLDSKNVGVFSFLLCSRKHQCPAVSTQTNPVESSFSLLILWCDPYIMGIGLS